MINTEIRQFRDSIIAMTNACPLPIEIKRLVFSEINSSITIEADKVIEVEKQQVQTLKQEDITQEDKENE